MQEDKLSHIRVVGYRTTYTLARIISDILLNLMMNKLMFTVKEEVCKYKAYKWLMIKAKID